MRNLTKRPWQSVVLIIGNILGIVGIIFGTIIGLYTFLVTFIISQNASIAANFLGIFPVIMGVSFVMIIIMTLITMGVFYGKRWVVGIILIGMIFNFFNGVIIMVKALIAADPQYVLAGTIGLLVTSFVIWLSISSLKHPFYGGDHSGFDWKSWEGVKSVFRRNKNVDEMTTF